MPIDLYRPTLMAKRTGHPGLADAYLAVFIALATVLLVATMHLSLTDAQNAGDSNRATVLIGP